MPVYAKQYGRLGNNLFQKAAAIGYAMKHGIEYNICPWYTKNTINYGHPYYIKEAGHQYQELYFHEELRYSRIMLDGYWQSVHYFAHCREEVLKAFGYPWELKEGSCSIHVRRGDYLKYPDKHPVVSMEYIKEAIYTVNCNNEMACPKAAPLKFMVFSDDIPWCIDHFSSLPYHFHYSIDQTPEEDLIDGSCCEHNIISNSSFSWWQAWLNQNPNKVVISPSKNNWFGPGNVHLDTSDLIPESWIQIKY